MVLSIIAGLALGVVGFIPLFIGLRLTRKVTTTSNFGHMAILLLSLFASFLILLIAAVVCISVARQEALAFVLSEAVGLSVTAIVFGIVSIKRK